MNKVLYIILIFLITLAIFSCAKDEPFYSDPFKDTTAPVIEEVTFVTTPTNDSTPDYTFSSDEAGTITYGGSCSSSTTSAIDGNNTITLVSLSEGTYSNCTITVTDSAENVSKSLTITSFIIDLTAATLAEVTAVTTLTNDSTPDYTFSSSEAGTITYGGSCSSSTTSATTDNNTITLISLSDGTYSNCTIIVTDSAGNSVTRNISSFVIDTTAPTVSSISPTDNQTGVSISSNISVTFSEAMDNTSVTTNTDNTSCSGTLGVSSDNFNTCVQMSSSPSNSNSDKTFTLDPSAYLSYSTTYKTRVTTGVKDAAGNALSSQYETSNGFTAPESLDSILETIRNQYDLPAIGGLVLQGDAILASGMEGLRKMGTSISVTIEDLFVIGSCTKAMTATLLGVLVEKGELQWQTTLEEAFPNLASEMHETYKNVTLEQLLRHRGGVTGSLSTDYPDIWSELWQKKSDPIMGVRSWFTEQILSMEPDGEVGTYLYSNSSYMIVGAAMELVVGESWESLMREHIFDPLGMSSCGFGAPDTTGNVEQPWGHTGSTPKNSDNPPALGPAGTVHCSLEGWSKFIAIHLSGSRGTPRLLSADSFQKMHDPSGSNYALGWNIRQRTWAGGTTLSHYGSNTYSKASVWIAPEKNTALLVVTNRADTPASNGMEAALGAMISSYIE